MYLSEIDYSRRSKSKYLDALSYDTCYGEECVSKQHGAVVARGAHNPEVTRSKRVAAIHFLVPTCSMNSACCTF